LLSYLDSTDDVPEDDIDRINIRDNLKLAQVCGQADSNFDALLNSVVSEVTVTPTARRFLPLHIWYISISSCIKQIERWLKGNRLKVNYRKILAIWLGIR